MTITRREGSRLAATGSDVSAPVAPPTAPPRRSHVPNDGSAEALAVESARKSMLHEGPVRKRTRIGADAVCEALIRQGVDLFFGYPGGVVLPLYDVLGGTSWFGTSRVGRTRPTVTRGRRAGSGSAWERRDRGPPTS